MFSNGTKRISCYIYYQLCAELVLY